MFGRRKKSWREQEIYEQLLQNVHRSGLAEKHSELRRCAAREAREMARWEEMQEQALLEARRVVRKAGAQHTQQRAARKRLQEIAERLQHDGGQLDEAFLRRLAHIAFEGYLNGPDGWRYTPALVQKVFEDAYKRALESKIFFNPFTGEIEKW